MSDTQQPTSLLQLTYSAEPRPIYHHELPAILAALKPRGCVCPPGAEASCQGIGCPRRAPVREQSAVAVVPSATPAAGEHPPPIIPPTRDALTELRDGQTYTPLVGPDGAVLRPSPADAPAPVDWTARTLTDGSPVTPDHREINPKTGQQKAYVVLSEAERAKGFKRPVRSTYKHLTCGGVTTMGRSLGETYAREPCFYSGTFCSHCGAHFPVGEDGEFVWYGTDEKVGT